MQTAFHLLAIWGVLLIGLLPFAAAIFLLLVWRFSAIDGRARLGAKAPKLLSLDPYEYGYTQKFLRSGMHRELSDPAFSMLVWLFRCVWAPYALWGLALVTWLAVTLVAQLIR